MLRRLRAFYIEEKQKFQRLLCLLGKANLSIVVEKIGKNQEKCKLIFSTLADNDVNNEWVKEYGLYIKNGEEYRELHTIRDISLVREPNNYDGILQLV